MIFKFDRILEIHAKAIDERLYNKRDQLLGGIESGYASTLTNNAGSKADQLLSDLEAMNTDGLVDGDIPLERWLRNAAYAVRIRPEKQRYFGELAEQAKVAALAGPAPEAAGKPLSKSADVPAARPEGPRLEIPARGLTSALVRRLLMEALSDEELSELAMDRFPLVYGQFSAAMARTQKIQRLLEHAQRQRMMDALAEEVRRRSPATYAAVMSEWESHA